MRTALKYVPILIILAGCAGPKVIRTQGNLPESRQATLVESYSPTEWMIRAAGIGTEGGKRVKESSAVEDARRSAVYFVLYMGTDPLLTTSEEKTRFALIEQEFFANDNVMKYIAWEAAGYDSRISLPDKRVKIEKTFRLNVGLIREDLVARGVLTAVGGLTEALGLPQIMVIPEVRKGDNPLEAMETRPELKTAARTIESYLTQRRYDVVVPQQQDFLDNYYQTFQAIGNVEDDPSYKLALSVGTDIYITYSVEIGSSYVGSTENAKASVAVRAFETTTARLLGTETGYSDSRPGSTEAITEEAIHDAVDKVLARLTAYWKDDTEKGVQYKVIFDLAGGNFDKLETSRIQDAVADVMKGISNRTKENIATGKTLDYLIWAKPDKYTRARELFNAIRDDFAAKGTGAAIEQRQLNRKLLLLAVNR
jgi:hypothetical protein